MIPRRPPIEKFPIKPRRDGRFQKRINGKLYYFGSNGDRDAAIKEYERNRNSLYAGVPLPPEPTDVAAAQLGDIIERYLTHLAAEVRAGRLGEPYYKQSERALLRLADAIGENRPISDLTPDDFSSHARTLSGTLGSYAFNRERAIVGAMLNFADEFGWISHPVRIGRGFRKVGKAVLRQQRADRLLEPRQYAALLAGLPPTMEAMALLAGNGGYGWADLSNLTWAHIDLNGAIIRSYPRVKTGIDRTTPLWPETVEALRELPRREGDPLVFRTVRGNPWSDTSGAHEWEKHVARIDAEREAFGLDKIGPIVLGDLRHTFATYASEAADGDAWRRVMGHVMEGLKDTYVETIFEPRLRKLCEHVRVRLLRGD